MRMCCSRRGCWLDERTARSPPAFTGGCFSRSTTRAPGSLASAAASLATESLSISIPPRPRSSTRGSCSTTCTSRSTPCAGPSGRSSWRATSTCCGSGSSGSMKSWRRAAPRADPITRELYISRAAEVAGVRKDVLEQETGNEKREASAAPTFPVSRVPFPALPAGAEKALLLLLLAGEPWRARVIEAVAPEELEFIPYREVFEAVARDAVLSLSETSARAYEALKDEGLGERDPDELYERAVRWIEAGRLERRLEEIDRRLPLESPEGQASLIAEKRRVFDELRKRSPRYKIAARRRSAPGT